MANIDELKAKWQNSAADIQRRQEDIRRQLQEEFHSNLKEFWEAFPTIHALNWRQYTPYFNDGESCEFTVYGQYALTEPKYNEFLAAKHEEGCAYAEEYSNWSNDWYRRSTVRSLKDLSKVWSEFFADAPDGLFEFLLFLKSIPKDIYLITFGDHVEVTVTRELTTVEEYSHG